MTTPCCGCIVDSDYGTDTITGEGSPEDPYSLTQIDPSFKRPVAKITRTGGQIASTGIETPVSFTSAVFDTHGAWAIGNPTRITIPITGLYLFGFNNRWGAAANQVRETFFRLNGTIELDRQSHIKDDAVLSVQWYDMTYQWYFSAGDYIEAVCFQTSGADVVMGNLANFWLMYLGKKF